MKSRFESWVQEHHAAVYRTALRLVRNAEDAQDVTQEVFLKALTQEERLESAEDPGRVLCWMASKSALMHLRGDRRRKRREDEAVAMQDRAHENDDTEVRAEVLSLFERLPEELRLALTLRFQENMTFAQLSEVLAISQPSAHDRVRRGLARLREWLQRSSPALVAIPLEQHLKDAPLAPVPLGLSERLLSLETAKLATVTVLSKSVFIVAAVVLVGASLALSSLPRGDSSTSNTELALSGSAPKATQDPLSPTGRSLVTREDAGTPAASIDTPAGSSLTQDGFAEITGRVLQPDSTPAVDVQVIASSFARSGKFATYANRAETDENGVYSIRVPAQHEDGDDYELHVQYEKARLSQPQSVRVSTGEQRTAFDLQLESPLEERNGLFELELAIEDESGLLLPAESIVTLERYLHTIGGGTYPHWEAGGRLDVAGRIKFSGSKLGPKRVLVSCRVADEWLRYAAYFEVQQEGAQTRTVTATLTGQSAIWRGSGTSTTERAPHKFGLSGTASELATNSPVLRSDHDVWYYEVPELTPHELLYDYSPNKIFRGPFQSAAFNEVAPPTTDRFSSYYELAAGRYVAVGYELPYAPSFSDVVELTEDYPHAEDLRLWYEAPGTLTGVLRDMNGDPIENGLLTITGTGPISDAAIASLDDHVRKSRGEGSYLARYWRTDSDGRFSINGLPSTIPVRVVALDPWREPASSETVFAASAATLAGVDLQFRTKRTR